MSAAAIRAVRTVADRLDRALVIGHELYEIDRDPDLHRLSRKAWVGHSLALAGFNSLGG